MKKIIFNKIFLCLSFVVLCLFEWLMKLVYTELYRFAEIGNNGISFASNDVRLGVYLLKDIGEQGRNYVLTHYLPLSIIYLMVYTLFSHSILSYFIQFFNLNRWRFIIYLPLIVVSLHALECFIFSFSAYYYPNIIWELWKIIPFISPFKSLCISVTYLLCFLFLVSWIVKKGREFLSSKNKNEKTLNGLK